MIVFIYVIVCIVCTVSRSKGLQFSNLHNEFSNGEQHTRFKRQGEKCGSKVDLLDCDLENSIPLSRADTNRFRAKYTQGDKCDVKKYVFDWSLVLSNDSEIHFNDYYNKETFIIEPYMLGSGEHIIMVYVKEYLSENDYDYLSPPACLFNIRPEIPLPQISGGSEVTVNSGEDFEISGRESLDMDVRSGQKGNLVYKWTCELVKGQNSEYCQGVIGSGPFIVVPKRHAIDGLSYKFTLSVRTAEVDWQGVNQIVHFKQHVAVLSIKCLKNCFPSVLKTNSKEAIILEVVCSKNCYGITPEAYEWSINVQNFDYGTNTKNGRNTNIFFINANVLQVGSKPKISVILSDGLGEKSAIELEIHRPPNLESCSVTPNNGEALKTKFIVERCVYDKGHYLFEIYSIQDEREVLLNKGFYLKDLLFTLSPGSKVKVKIIDDYRFSSEMVLDVSVTSALKNVDTKENLENEIKKVYFDGNSENSIDNLIEQRNYDTAIQVMNSLVDELAKLPKNNATKDTVKKYREKILKCLEKIPLNIADQAKQIGSLAEKIVNSVDPDPDILMLGSNLCKKSAEREQTLLKKERFPESFSNEFNTNIGVQSKCSQASTVPNLKIMEVKEDISVPTTPYPILDLPVIIEDYPDYVDDQNMSKFMTKFETASNNLINICYICSKSLTFMMSTEEEKKSVNAGFFTVTATKNIGRLIVNTKIESHNVTLNISKDFNFINSETDVLMCTSTRNPFWWALKEEIFTSVAMLQFHVQNKIVDKFRQPFLISFPVNNGLVSLIEKYEGITPRIPNNTRTQEEYDFETISVHRIDVYRKQGFVVEFHNLTENDVFDVFIADFRKPTYKEFKEKARHVSKGNNIIHTYHNRNYDTWNYLCVLPYPNKGIQIKYEFSVYTFSCSYWSASVRKWEFACASTEASNFNKIICECYHSSTLAGNFKNNRVTIEETLYVEHELEVQASYIIFISVAVVYLLYCVILSCLYFKSKKKKLDKNVYFLGDIPSNYRHGYLLIIKTGNKKNAGTTSNVVVKLYGKNSESKEHVLNYPDPQKKLLQKNQEDWFLIATELHLGDIEKIEIWFDHIGYRPQWYCNEIEIFDLQEQKYWLFEINKWFEVLTREQTIYVAFPRNESQSKMSARNIFNLSQGPHMWNLITYANDPFSRTKRLTIILSIFMTTYITGLFFYGCPKLQNSDSLAYTIDYGLHLHLFLITIYSFVITFIIHFPIVYLFRYCKENAYLKKSKMVKASTINSLCWCILIFYITLTMTLLVIFGFWVPYITGLLWLSSTFTSILVYVFLLENVIKFVSNLMVKQQTRIHSIFEQIKSIIGYVELQRSMLYKKFGETVLRPYFAHLYEPLNSERIKVHKHWAQLKERIFEIVEDLVMITTYVTLLYLVILKDKDPMTCLSHKEAQELIRGVHSRTIQIDNIGTRREFQEYINKTLIVSLQSLQWYGKYVSKDPGLTIDKSKKYIGVARLRQLRANSDYCSVPIQMKFIKEVCVPEYSNSPEYGNFSEGWWNDNYSDKFARMDKTWDYTSALEAGTLAYVGKFSTYPGGGYIATLGRTMKNSLINIRYLFRNRWIDGLSRCVFIEFLLYNPNSNLFNSIRIKFETSATGYIRRKFNVDTTKLLFRKGTGVIIRMFLLSFVAMVIIMLFKLIFRIIKKGKTFFSDIWYFADMFIVLSSLACLFLYVERSHMVKIFLLKIERAKHNQFVNYFNLFYAEATLTTIAAILVFLSTLRLWKLLRFLVIIRIVEKTLVLSAKPLLSIFLCQILFVLGFTLSGVTLFGDQSYDFKDIPDTIVTLTILSLNLHQHFDFEVLKTPLHYIYYSIFMIVTLLIYTLYIAIITISYAEAQIYYTNNEDYNVVNYVKEQYGYYSSLAKVKWKNFRTRGGNDPDEERKVTPKADEHRYAKCLTTTSNKFYAMENVTKCLLRNMKTKKQKLTDNDVNLMKQTITNLFREDTDDKEFFFMSNLEGHKVKLVDDKTLQKMEKITEVILTKRDGSYDKEKQKLIYNRIIAKHEEKINGINENLNVILNVLSKVNVEVKGM